MSVEAGWRKQTIASLFGSSRPGEWGTDGTRDSGTPVLRSTNFCDDGSIDYSDIAYRTVPASRLDARRISVGTILIEKAGGSSTRPAGRVVYCDREFGGTASNFVEVIQIGEALSPKYVFYLLYNNFHSGLVYKYQQQTTGIINFKLREYGSEFVSIPESHLEQSKIAEVLSTVDRVIAQTEALIAKQQRIKTGLMQDLLTRGIDEHGQLRSEATHAFKDSPLGRIPVEWEVCSLGQVTQKIADRDHTTPKYVDDGVLIISPMAFFDDESIDFSRCPRITRAAHNRNCEKTDSRVGDIIIHRIGAGLGRVRVVEDEHPEYSLLHSLALIRPDFEVSNTFFLKWSLRSSIVQAQMALGMQSIGVPDLGLDKIASLQFRMPTSLHEQEAIGHALNNEQNRIDELTSSKRKLDLLKSGLMQDLLTGKVRVTTLLQQPETATA